MQKQKGFILPIIIVAVVVIILGAAGYFAYKQNSAPKQPEQIVCTKEAKLCPDGSAIGRIGPNCEFADCPEVLDETAGWKTYRNDEYEFEFQYPENGNVKTGYDWTPDFWPPQVKIISINEDVVRVCPISAGGYYEQLKSSLKFVEINGFGNPVSLYKLSYNGTKTGSLRYCYVVKSTKVENYILYFEFTSTTDVNHAIEKDVDALTEKIISTFKFTPVK
ncbi:MAG: hypothetical protein CEN87_67 [Parcubacteria group bacterium Licking1014_1]|nr:MAG: hypothetical protein CEN87_67 [Parcubacteria group bacterium Licking1014_1]